MKRSVLAAAVAAFTAVALTACSTGKSLEGGEEAKESTASSKIVSPLLSLPNTLSVQLVT